MRSVCWRIALSLSLCLFQAVAMGQPLKTLGYLAWWMPESWRTVPLNELDRLLWFEFKVDALGTVSERHGWPEQWQGLQTETVRQHVALDLVLTLFDPSTFNALFTSAEAIDRLLAESLSLAGSDKVAGLHLDFEIFEKANPLAIERYRGFVMALSQQLHQSSPPKSLSVFCLAGSGTSLYDADTLKHADYVVMQSYDTHYRGSQNAGPIAPLQGTDTLTWQSAAAAGVALGVPKHRLIFSFPLFGYEWPVKNNKVRSRVQGSGKTTTFAAVAADVLPSIQINITQRVQQYGALHDPVSGSAYYKFKDGSGQWMEGWFEDWWTLGQKFDFLTREKLGGMAFFLLGYDQGELVRYYLQRRGSKNIDTLIEQIQSGDSLLETPENNPDYLLK